MNFALSLALSASLSVAASQSAPSPAPTPANDPPTATAATAAPQPAVPGNVLWASSVEEAQARAAREGKFVFYEFTKADCGNCKRMDDLLYPAVDFEALLASMVPVKIEKDSSLGKELSARYGIREAPSVLVTTAEGRLVFLMDGFFNQADFFRQANSSVAAYRQFARKIESENIAKLPALEALQTGSALYRRSDPQAALPRLKRAVAAAGKEAAVRDDALELLAAVELELGQPAEARKTIDRLLTVTKDGARRERAELFRAQIPLAENRPAEALALFRKFQKDHPGSPHIGRVNELVERLQARMSPQ